MSTLHLTYATGPRRDQALMFAGPRVRIGRSRDNDIPLPAEETPRSSAHHAEARLEGNVWWIVDLGSTNGTLLNGATIQRAQLHTGDRITIGDQEFLVAIRRRRGAWLLAAIAVAAISALAFVIVRQMRPSPFQAVAASAARSVYLVAVDDGGRSAIGTAFAVSRAPALLATNAHVVDAMTARVGGDPRSGGRAVALRSDDDRPRTVGRTWVHPAWRRGSVAADVALIELMEAVDVAPLPLGDARSIERLQRGAPLATFGFPAESTDPARPRGRLAVDVVGDVRLPYIEAGLFIAPGTSGSPVFDDTGVVVGIVVGGDFVAGTDGRGRRPSGSGVNWVIAVTGLQELIATVRGSSFERLR